MTSSRRPLWVERLLLVLFSPLLISLAFVLATIDALSEGAKEFLGSFALMWADMARRWRGK